MLQKVLPWARTLCLTMLLKASPRPGAASWAARMWLPCQMWRWQKPSATSGTRAAHHMVQRLQIMLQELQVSCFRGLASQLALRFCSCA